MVKNKNGIHNKTILKWSYFQAFNLITLNESFYDCDRVFELIRFNIQYNLKTESDFSDYLANCQSMKLKRKDSSDYNIQDNKPTFNYLFLFQAMLSFSILVAFFLCLYLFFRNHRAIETLYVFFTHIKKFFEASRIFFN